MNYMITVHSEVVRNMKGIHLAIKSLSTDVFTGRWALANLHHSLKSGIDTASVIFVDGRVCRAFGSVAHLTLFDARQVLF